MCTKYRKEEKANELLRVMRERERERENKSRV